MDIVLTFLILSAPFALAALLSWSAHRGDAVRAYLSGVTDDPDWYRIQHDADAARTRFEDSPSWPASGAVGERR
ncbi:hypothetical protein [Mycolicibacterium grossiae]|uniref:Uncharacterized protein n=1 Tax=Mycolicibacterium grossiae TaxID=1552759 RepID=A0A1E8Q5F1_9MYCO|nr:hypothetical protein [Mycolicibacterium grossiae]OFJ53705.1 hypothetical protein BEL07_10760 [Mycolicibacterium grossiae]QEM43906.1 hypothetical protein FZ046_03095 [Mycolicibacterium grossiae]